MVKIFEDQHPSSVGGGGNHGGSSAHAATPLSTVIAEGSSIVSEGGGSFMSNLSAVALAAAPQVDDSIKQALGRRISYRLIYI